MDVAEAPGQTASNAGFHADVHIAEFVGNPAADLQKPVIHRLDLDDDPPSGDIARSASESCHAAHGQYLAAI